MDFCQISFSFNRKSRNVSGIDVGVEIEPKPKLVRQGKSFLSLSKVSHQYHSEQNETFCRKKLLFEQQQQNYNITTTTIKQQKHNNNRDMFILFLMRGVSTSKLNFAFLNCCFLLLIGTSLFPHHPEGSLLYYDSAHLTHD